MKASVHKLMMKCVQVSIAFKTHQHKESCFMIRSLIEYKPRRCLSKVRLAVWSMFRWPSFWQSVAGSHERPCNHAQRQQARRKIGLPCTGITQSLPFLFPI